MKEISSLIKLTRWNEWILTLLILVAGYFIALGYASPGTNLIALVIAFSLSSAFGFAINDYFDAPYDKLKPVVRNVISNKSVSKSHAAAFCAILLLACIAVGYYFLPAGSFLLLLVMCLLFFVYSSPPFRMKERTYMDIINHGMSYPVLFLAGYAINRPLGAEAAMFSISAFIISLLVDITQEVRDMNVDKKSGFRTTSMRLGYGRCLTILKILTCLAVGFFVVGVIISRQLYVIFGCAGIIFYIRVLASNPPASKLYDRTIKAWNRGIAVSSVIGIIILLYIYFMPGS